jgi:hypothetical protein
MALVEDDDVIQAFSADRTDETLSVRVLPGRSRRSNDLREPHRSNAMTKCRTIGFVSVPPQIARCGVPRKGLGHLTRKPALRWIWCDRKVDDPSAIQDLARSRRRAGGTAPWRPRTCRSQRCREGDCVKSSPRSGTLHARAVSFGNGCQAIESASAHFRRFFQMRVEIVG